MNISTERLTIRSIEETDWLSMKHIWEDLKQSEYAQYDTPKNTEESDVRARIAKWAEASKGMDHMFYAVCLDDKMIGFIACNIREQGYEIAYGFHSNYQGKGYAKESHQALFSYLKKMGITRFSAGTALNNLPSVKLLEKLGFRQTGTEKVSFYKDQDGNDIIFDGGLFELDTK